MAKPDQNVPTQMDKGVRTANFVFAVQPKRSHFVSEMGRDVPTPEAD
jgi:hypothetical protein